MHDIPWYLVLTISIPQVIMMICIGYTLCNIRIEFDKCVLCALIMALASQPVRNLPVPLAVNTVILTLLLIAVTGLVFRIHAGKALIACLLGVMISGVIEGVVTEIFLFFTGHFAAELAVDAVLNMIAFIPVFLCTLAIYFIIEYTGFVAFDLSETQP